MLVLFKIFEGQSNRMDGWIPSAVSLQGSKIYPRRESAMVFSYIGTY